MLNSFQGVGSLIGAPTYGQTQNGKPFAKFTIGIPRAHSNGPIKQPSVDRINCDAYGNVAETLRSISVHDIVSFTGSIQTSAYQKDGVWINSWSVYVRMIETIYRPAQPGQPKAQPAPAAPAAPVQYNAAPPVPPTPPESCAPPPDMSGTFPFDLYGY